MKTPESVGKILEQTFCRIHRENMQGIPILNSKIAIQALGFQEFEGRLLGIIITPWLMNVVLLPSIEDDWSDLKLGQKTWQSFPSKKYRFLVNEIDGIGFCQTHSIYSPMNDFTSHEQAEKVALDFIKSLMICPDPMTSKTEEELVDEELLGRIMRGEETPEVNFDDFAVIEPNELTIPIKEITEMKEATRKKFDRRALLRGNFQGET